MVHAEMVCEGAAARLPLQAMTLAHARSFFGNKMFWANINVGVYGLPPAELRRWVRERVRAAAPDGRGLVFEISEDLPTNWREAVPVVLETLKEYNA